MNFYHYHFHMTRKYFLKYLYWNINKKKFQFSEISSLWNVIYLDYHNASYEPVMSIHFQTDADMWQYLYHIIHYAIFLSQFTQELSNQANQRYMLVPEVQWTMHLLQSKNR